MRNLHDLQRTLYERAYRIAAQSPMIAAPELKAYASGFEASLPDSFQPIARDAVYKRLLESQIILFGDFHTLRYSQHEFKQLVERLGRNSKRRVILALEMFRSSHQSVLDAYLGGEIGKSELLDGVSYAQTWGFPWENYEKIIELAMTSGLPIEGIAPEDGSPQARDRFVANRLAKIAQENEDAIIVCMIGEFHLADNHLPQEIRRICPGVDLTRILNNVDKYFVEPSASETEYLSLGKDMFCILNTAAWMKWKSVSTFEDSLEGHEDALELGHSFDETFAMIVTDLCRFLKIPARDFIGNFYIRDSSEFLDTQTSMPTLRTEGYEVPLDGGDIVLTEPTINNLAKAAGQHIQRTLWSRDAATSCPEEVFFRNVFKVCAGGLAAKIMNPKVEIEGLVSHRRRVADSYRQKVYGQERLLRSNSRVLLQILDAVSRSTKVPRALFQRGLVLDKSTPRILSSALGNCLAVALFDHAVYSDDRSSLVESVFCHSHSNISSYQSELAYLTRRVMHI